MDTRAPDYDIACAVALGFVEHPRMVVNLQQLTLLDSRAETIALFPGWLSPSDKLHLAAREYLTARDEAQKASGKVTKGNGSWNAAGAVKVRETANARALIAKQRGRELLAERGVFAKARSLGLRVYS